MTVTNRKIVLVTGSSSGFGFLIALQLAHSNCTVIATMRNLSHAKRLREAAEKLHISKDHLLIHQLDVTNHHEIETMKQFITAQYGRIDILINNAGFSQGGVIEDVPIEKWEQQFQTNFFGVVAITKAFLPMMRKARNGKIILIGSISGRLGLPGLAPYASSKFALEGFAESLRLELKPFHVYTSLIEAGSFQTNIWQKGVETAIQSDIKDYQSLMTFMNKYARNQGQSSDNPEKVVELVCHICKINYPRFRYPIGKGVKLTVYLKSLLPWSIVEKIVYKLLK